jgi:hypothetical protein
MGTVGGDEDERAQTQIRALKWWDGLCVRLAAFFRIRFCVRPLL